MRYALIEQRLFNCEIRMRSCYNSPRAKDVIIWLKAVLWLQGGFRFFNISELSIYFL